MWSGRSFAMISTNASRRRSTRRSSCGWGAAPALHRTPRRHRSGRGSLDPEQLLDRVQQEVDEEAQPTAFSSHGISLTRPVAEPQQDEGEDADADAVGDAVGERHRDHRQERRDADGEVAPVDRPACSRP